MHFGLPMSIANYYRQIAQAAPGASCALLVSELDFYENKAHLQLKQDTLEDFNYLSAFQKLAEMYAYTGRLSD